MKPAPTRMTESRVALVTGAAGGIGAALVSELETLGFQVFAADIDKAAVTAVAKELGWHPDHVQAIGLDVTSAEDWRRVIGQIISDREKLDTLFNVAGIMRAAWVEETPLEDIDSILAVDLKGVILGTKYAAEEMIKQGNGHIINFSSMLGLAPGPGMSVYAGAKYGVRGFTISAAIELKPQGIAVSLVCPDRIDTGLFNFPNAQGPQAAIAYSGPPALQVQDVVPGLLRKILKKKPLILAVPRGRGLLARLSESFPHKIYAYLSAKGGGRQRKEFSRTLPTSPKTVATQQAAIEEPRSASTELPPPSSNAPPNAPPSPPISDTAVNTVIPPDIERIYTTARKAAKQLRETTVKQRLDLLRPLESHLIEHRDQLSRQLGKEAGKPALEALQLELTNVLMGLRYYRKHAVGQLREKRIGGLPFQFKKRYSIRFEPLGVILILAPYNYPLTLSLLPALEAFLAGNAVIIKPSEQCPLTEIWKQLMEIAALPDGSLQIANIQPDKAPELIEAGPDHIHLTGGCQSGIQVATLAAKKLIPTSTELGGKDVAIVFDDADLERAVEAIAWAFLIHQGQTCAGIKRLLIHTSVYEKFQKLLVARIELHARSVETSHDFTWESPALRAEHIRGLLQNALQNGMQTLLPTSGTPHDWTTGALQPIILSGGDISLPIWQEETWGPVLVIQSFDEENEAIQHANDSRFGLGASVWSQDHPRARRVAIALEVGGVSINNTLGTMAHPGMPYGGVKHSGWGRQRGAAGLRNFSNTKAMLLDKGSLLEPYWLPHTSTKFALFSEFLAGISQRGIKARWKTFKAAGQMLGQMRRSRKK